MTWHQINWTNVFHCNNPHTGSLNRILVSDQSESALDGLFDVVDSMYSNPSPNFHGQVNEAVESFREISKRMQLSWKMHQSLMEALDDAKSLLERELLVKLARDSKPAMKSPIVDSLTADGLWSARIPNSRIDCLIAQSDGFRNRLDNERRLRGGFVAPISIPPFSQLFNSAVAIVNELGLSSAAKQYLGFPVYPAYVALQESVAEETWWCNPFGKNGLEYLHLDFDFDMLKVIIYLSEVTEDTGPFRYIENSTQFSYSPSWLAFYKCFEKRLEKHYGSPRSEHNSYYYRTRFLSQEFLSDSARLPCNLFGASHFGDDVANDSKFFGLLCASERSLLTKDVNCFLFDGSRLMHRGGMVNDGTRLALQVGLLQLDQSISGKLSRSKNYLRAQARKLVKGT